MMRALRLGIVGGVPVVWGSLALMDRLRRPRIAVVEVFGVLAGARRSAEYARLLSNLADDRRVAAVVLDIDSPGGTAAVADYLYGVATRLAQRKPLIAFIRGQGTSGAYLLACAAHRVVAIPAAVVGSIGALSVRPVLVELLHRLGVRVLVTKSGPFKDMGLIFREPTEEERRKEQELIDSFFQRFLELVAQARGLSQEKLREYATGEVFTAGRGRELGLLDELGDLDRAVDLAAEMANVPRRVSYVRLRRPLAERLFSPAMASLTETVEGLLASAVVYRRPS